MILVAALGGFVAGVTATILCVASSPRPVTPRPRRHPVYSGTVVLVKSPYDWDRESWSNN